MTTAPTNGSGATTSRRPFIPPTSHARAEAGDRLPVTRRQRRPVMAVAGTLLVLLCAVASAALVGRGSDRLAVLSLARDLPAGHVLTGSDLRVAHVAGDGLTALSATAQNMTVGQTLTASLPAGTLLNADMVSAAPPPAAGWQLVSVAVKPGAVPFEASAGRDVSVLRVDTGGTHLGPAVLVAKARVVSVRRDAATGTVVLSLQVPAAAAAAVAQAGSSGAVALTLLPIAP